MMTKKLLLSSLLLNDVFSPYSIVMSLIGFSVYSHCVCVERSILFSFGTHTHILFQVESIILLSHFFHYILDSTLNGANNKKKIRITISRQQNQGKKQNSLFTVFPFIFFIFRWKFFCSRLFVLLSFIRLLACLVARIILLILFSSNKKKSSQFNNFRFHILAIGWFHNHRLQFVVSQKKSLSSNGSE